MLFNGINGIIGISWIYAINVHNYNLNKFNKQKLKTFQEYYISSGSLT